MFRSYNDPEVKRQLATQAAAFESGADAILLAVSTADGTLAFLAGLPHKKIVDIAANNQERMLRCPAIVDALGGNPLDAVLDGEAQELLQEALETLPPEQRAVFVLRAVEEMSYAEIADALERSGLSEQAEPWREIAAGG